MNIETKKKLNILIVTQYFWPENFRINDLVHDLDNKGHNVTVLTGKPNYPKGEFFSEYVNSPSKYNQFGSTSIIRVPMTARGKGGARLLLNYFTFCISASFFGVYKLHNKEFDVIFVFEPSPITVGIPAIILRKIKKTPIVFWVLDLWPETLAAIGVIKSQSILNITGILVSFIYKRCDLILGQSKGFEGAINKYSNDSTKFRYFPNWTESVFEKKSNKNAPEILVNKNTFNIIFTGNIGEAQDFPSILDAAEQIEINTGVRWYIIGNGRMSDWLQNEVNRRSLGDRFFLLGRFPLERMPSFYNTASALLVSLKSEPIFSLTIPGKIQSYMAAGKPILTMLDGIGSKLIDEANAGLTAPSGNSLLLKKNIEKMLSMNTKELETMGLNGQKHSNIEFSKARLLNKLEQWLYEASQ